MSVKKKKENCFLVIYTADLKVELCRPLKMNPTPTKLEQVKTWRKIFLDDINVLGPSSCFPQKSHSTKLGDSNAISPLVYSHIVNILQIFSSFHKVSLKTVQTMIMMEIEHTLRPSLTFSVSSMTAILSTKSGQQPIGQCITYTIIYFYLPFSLSFALLLCLSYSLLTKSTSNCVLSVQN